MNAQGKYKDDGPAHPFQITRSQNVADRNAETRGTANPSIMNKPFWKYMIATGEVSYFARKRFHDEGFLYEDSDSPVWCFHRFGGTAMRLPDGRHVHIGGEHEDHYDPDFCIYNDVVVIAAPATEGNIPYNCSVNPRLPTPFPRPTSPETITIYGYPVDVFPPIDFHTATYFRDPMSGKEFIFIVGGLGCMGSVSRDRTDVYRLDLSDFSIRRLETSGAKPAGGTYEHTARLVDEGNGNEAAIEITTKEGEGFSLFIDRLEWISRG